MLFYRNKLLNYISCPIVCKIFFLLRIPRYSGKVVEKKEEEEAITKRFIFQENAAKLLLFKIFAM